jgi:deazaflavin-dependent oxidoreductase (nitroreductase family)
LKTLVRRLGHKPWFAAAARHVVWLDRWLQKRSKGRITVVTTVGLDTLLLTTTGRRSGRPREQPLLFVRDGADFIVVGSNWGRPQHPAWTGNLLAQPRCVVTYRKREITAVAEPAEGGERDRLWAKLVEHWPAYDSYEARAAGREIRIFRLRTVRNGGAD